MNKAQRYFFELGTFPLLFWRSSIIGVILVATMILTETTTEGSIIAATGFNDRRGINSERRANSPYRLNATADGQGAGETGWSGTWTVVSGPVTRSNVQRGVTQEGDGALHIRHTSNTFRHWASPQSGVFTVEQHLDLRQIRIQWFISSKARRVISHHVVFTAQFGRRVPMVPCSQSTV